MPFADTYTPDPRFTDLGPDFADAVDPARFPQAQLRYWNDRWADSIGLGGLSEAEKARHFHGFAMLPDNQHRPLAMRYHGHQFRTYNPDIGDGRGFLFAQVRDHEGRLLDLATKGSGQTPWSRSGDGRLTLKGAVREILATEMLEALGVYTSKTFAVFETGEALQRNDEPSPTRSAVLTRLGHSHLRIGTFQRHAYEEAPERIEQLISHALEQYYPDLKNRPVPASTLMQAVAEASAKLCARWMAAGFVHGVLNTDNLNVTGESFDYGPWRFLRLYEPSFTAAYFDHTGLYAYARQPEAVYWALQQFAAVLGVVSDDKQLIADLNTFPAHYRLALLDAFLARFGLASAGRQADEEMIRAFLAFMQASQAPWEGVFFDHFCDPSRAQASARAGFYRGEAYEAWLETLKRHEAVRPERLDHPYFRADAPVHMTIETVEACWADIAERDDWSVFEDLRVGMAGAREAYDLGHGRSGFLRAG